tara:strand:+ start:2403 stop:2651 length:249 start_codon:yes stop_codon:yes gene_type:complete
MFNLCKYKNILGKPNEGIRKKYRLFNISLLDVGATIILALFIHFFLLKEVEFLAILISCFIGGILFHRFFCVRTTIDKFIFG